MTGAIWIVGIATVFGVLLFILWWLKWHCPLCSKRWGPTGGTQPSGWMGGRSAQMVEWKCPQCGHTDWIKTDRGGLW
jgi:hypothetical protein